MNRERMETSASASNVEKGKEDEPEDIEKREDVEDDELSDEREVERECDEP